MADDPAAAYLAAVRARVEAGAGFRNLRDRLAEVVAAMDDARRRVEAGGDPPAGPVVEPGDWPAAEAVNEVYAELLAANTRVLSLWRQLGPDRPPGLAPPRGAIQTPGDGG